MLVQEIERKWLIRTISPALFALITDTYEINYAYLDGWRNAELFFHNPENHDGAERKYCKVRKTGIGISKSEETQEITAEEFITAYENPEARLLTKIRHTFTRNGFTYEIDIYNEAQLATLEVEFESLEAANAFDLEKEAPKELLAEVLLEVSGNEKFSNAHLALSQEFQAWN